MLLQNTFILIIAKLVKARLQVYQNVISSFSTDSINPLPIIDTFILTMKQDNVPNEMLNTIHSVLCYLSPLGIIIIGK